MRVEFRWPNLERSVLQREDSATHINITDLPEWTVVSINGYTLTRPEQGRVGSEQPFPIGARVQLRGDLGPDPEHDYPMSVGSIGRVVDYTDDDMGHTVGVEWEGWHSGHDCDGSITDHQGWYVRTNDLVVVPSSQITITSYPTYETLCDDCGLELGRCFVDEGWDHEDRCLNDMWEGDDGQFYHEGCG